MSERTLVAGVGNIFLGDDGFGVEVVRRLGSEPAPPGGEIVDYGIRGIHLAYQLLEGYDTLVLIDAVSRGESPGTVFLIEPELDGLATPRAGPSAGGSRGSGREPRSARGAGSHPAPSIGDAHGLDPESVLRLVADLGGNPPRVRLVGCEPAEITERIGLSDAVAGAVDEAVRLVRSLLRGCPPPRADAGDGRTGSTSLPMASSSSKTGARV